MHAPFVRGLLREGDEPPGVPLPPGILLGCGRSGVAGPAAAAVAAGRAGEEGRATGGNSDGGGIRMNGKPPQGRGLTAIDGAMVLIVILLVVQIWLLSA